jgi:superfamily I DNA and/or RNA helicase
MNQHLKELLSALQSDHQYAHQEHQRNQALSFNERVSLGFAFPPLPLKSFGEGTLLLRIPKHITIHDGIEPGDLISIFPRSAEKLALPGICADIDAHSIEIRSREACNAPWITKGDICIQLRFDDRSFSLQEKGVQRAITHESPLKEALLGEWKLHAPENTPSRPNLNSAQSQAIETFLQNPNLSIIHGPPGTGKTYTIAALCAELVQQKKTIWVLADSNAAVDNLCTTLSHQNLDVLRLGSRFRISEKTWNLSIYHRMDTHSQAKALHKLEKEIRTSSGKEKGQLVREKRTLERNMRNSIIEYAPIIASTLGTMYKEAPYLPTPFAAIIDEASQVVDPAIWTLVPFISKLLLVGDPHQLGPVVLSQNKRLKQTLLKKKMEEQPCPMLNVQHRMHQSIHALVQSTYGSAYKPHPAVATQRLCDLPDIPTNVITQQQVIWIDTTGAEEGEERDPITHSLYNNTEIKWVCQAYHFLIQNNISDIGIITPYSAQVQRLRTLLPNADINTVTSFQGQEREVIICSFVRANFEGELGFVADAERLIVSLTRPKKLLVAIGDSSLLSQNKTFSALFTILEQHNHFMSIWEDTPFDKNE